MKDKLEPNMYIRTKWGYICKIININDFREPNMKYGVEANYLKDVMFIGDDDIIKASYDIIDILEENDYVNGLRVEKNKYGELYTSYVYYGGDIGKQCEVYTTWLKELEEDIIYSIVTHEQMEQMAYKVGE